MKPTFIISLDFELFWGMHGGDPQNSGYRENVSGGRRAAADLLRLFAQYGIHATWAVVGLMFAENAADAQQYFPPEALLPGYENHKLSPYPLLHALEDARTDGTLFFAPEVIARIAKTEGQEIASHTFSHFCCAEAGQTAEQFEADMLAAKEIARKKGYDLKTVVLPKNQCVDTHIQVLQKLGFAAYRDDRRDWIHKRIRLRPLLRLLRLADSYFPLTAPDGPDAQAHNGIVRLGGAVMFRPYCRPLAFLEKRKLKRIKGQMLRAAKSGRTFHLWWHPHNIGVRTQYHLECIEEILKYYVYLKETYGMQSKNMAEAAADAEQPASQ